MCKCFIISFVFLGLLHVGCKKEKNLICELYSNPVGYSIGNVESAISIPTKTTFKYTFTVNNVEYNGKEKSYGVGQNNKTMIGRQIDCHIIILINLLIGPIDIFFIQEIIEKEHKYLSDYHCLLIFYNAIGMHCSFCY